MGYKERIVFAVVQEYSETHVRALGFYKRKRDAALDCEKMNRQLDLFTAENRPDKARVARYSVSYTMSITGLNNQVRKGFDTVPITSEVQDKRRHA